MTATIELSSARKKLCDVLGPETPNEAMYFKHLKNWFRKRISKENFDLEARKLLAKEHAHLHNEFLLAILNKCQTLANFTPSQSNAMNAQQNQQQNQLSSVMIKSELMALRPDQALGSDRIKRGKIKTKRKSNRPFFDQRFQRVEAINGELVVRENELHERERSLKYAFREPTLPDVSLIHGRMIVTAWEERLEGVEDTAVDIVVKAVENQLRSLIMGLLMKRRGFKLREHRYPHAVGSKVANPWLINCQNIRGAKDDIVEVSETQDDAKTGGEGAVPPSRPTIEDAEQKEMFELACASDHTDVDQLRLPVSPFDLLSLLQEHKSVIPCHSVYAKNLERCIARLHHTGHDE